MSEKMDPEFQIDRRQLLGAGAASLIPRQEYEEGLSAPNGDCIRMAVDRAAEVSG